MVCGHLLDLVQPEVDPFDPLTQNPTLEPNVGRMIRCGDIADFSLRMRNSAIFLLPTEVLLTISELHTPIS